MQKVQKPKEGEYAPYAIMYIDLVPNDGLVLQHLQDNLEMMQTFINSFPEEKLVYRWTEGEWTIKEILIHVADTERIFGYRALRFARNDPTELAGFDMDAYVPNSSANTRSLESIMKEYRSVRQATLALFKNLEESAFTNVGMANGYPVTVRSLAYQIAGHELHHRDSIKENYL
ncbi:MAG: DinB family protein [Chloroflexota bacterium]